MKISSFRYEPGRPMRFALVAALALSAASCTEADPAVEGPIRLSGPVRTFGVDHPLYQIRDAALEGETLFVLTSPEPSVHVFRVDSPASYRAWGSEGSGPGELSNPKALIARSEIVHVLDMVPGKNRVNTYSWEGGLLRVSPISGIQIAYDFALIDGSFLVEAGNFGDRMHVIYRMDPNRGEMEAVAHVENQAPQVRLEPGDGPIRSYTIHLPFSAQPRWAATPAALAIWPGYGSDIQLLSLSGNTVGTVHIPDGGIPVDAKDRDVWLDRTFPLHGELFGVRNPYRELRNEVRNTVRFPDTFPPALRIEPAVGGGLWVLRAEKFAGEVWSLIDRNAEPVTLSMPGGRQVLAFGDEYVAAKVVDADGVETIELYRWADRMERP